MSAALPPVTRIARNGDGRPLGILFENPLTGPELRRVRRTLEVEFACPSGMIIPSPNNRLVSVMATGDLGPRTFLARLHELFRPAMRWNAVGLTLHSEATRCTRVALVCAPLAFQPPASCLPDWRTHVVALPVIGGHDVRARFALTVSGLQAVISDRLHSGLPGYERRGFTRSTLLAYLREAVEPLRVFVDRLEIADFDEPR